MSEKKRLSLIEILTDKFNDPDSGYDYQHCLEYSLNAIEHRWFTNLLNDYPPLLDADDLSALTNRYIDILRSLSEDSITDDYQIVDNAELKKQFARLITDIARIGSKELLLNCLYADNQNLIQAFAQDLPRAVNGYLLKQEQPTNYEFFDNKGCRDWIDCLIENLSDIVSTGIVSEMDPDTFVLAGHKPDKEQARKLEQDIQKLVRETLLDEKPESGYHYLTRESTKKEAMTIIREIFEFAKKDYVARHAMLNPEVADFLKLDQSSFAKIFDGYASDAVTSYLGAVMSDLLKRARGQNEMYEKAHQALNNYLKEEKYRLIKQGMLTPDNTMNLNDANANFRKGLYYPVEHKAEAAVAAGLTLTFGVVGLGGFLLFKALAPDVVDAPSRECKAGLRR